MQGLESLFNAKTSLQIVQMLSSIRSITLEGLPLETNLKTRVQVVSNTPKDASADADKENSSQDSKTKTTKNPTANNQTNAKLAKASNLLGNQTTANSAKNHTNSAPASNTSNGAATKTSAENLSTKSYSVLLQLADGRKVSANLPKPLPVGTKLELLTTGKNSGILRPLNSNSSNATMPASKDNTITQKQIQTALTQNLSKALPKQMALQEVLPQLQKLLTKLDSQTNIVDKVSIKQSIENIIKHFPQTKNAPPNAEQLKQAIQTNGVLFEANLAKMVNTPQSTANINADLKFLLQRASLLLQNALNADGNSSKFMQQKAQANVSQNQAQTGANRFGNTQAQLSSAASNLANATASQNLAQGANQNITQSNSQVGNQSSNQNTNLAQQNVNGENSGKNEILQQVSKLVDSAMAKIQTQQHSSLQQSQLGVENRANVQNMQVSIPFFANGSWQNVDMQLDKIELDADGKNATDSETNAKLWQVTLNFKLQNWGKITTRLVLRGENLRADLWLEDSEKYEKMQLASEELAARLRGIGAEVESVNCHRGTMNTRKAKPSSEQLIDTKV